MPLSKWQRLLGLAPTELAGPSEAPLDECSALRVALAGGGSSGLYVHHGKYTTVALSAETAREVAGRGRWVGSCEWAMGLVS